MGQYVITRKIGEGGMGTVWVGEHTLLGRRAAIKVLLPEYTSREEIVQRFFNEARAVTAIADPGIVQVFDFGYNAGSAYIVMELLEGEPMDARLRRIGRFEPLTAIRLMTQIATSLGAAHAKNVIHRDLKPENIFIVGDPAVTGGERTKILDFGIAKLAGDEASKVKTRTGMMMGTPVYMSPEQCRGAGSIDARSDIYTLGCVLFTMLCGRPPFEAEATGDLIIMHVRDAPPAPSQFERSVIPELDALMARCLQKDPNHRFQNTGELVQALHAVEAAMLGASAHRHPTPAPYDAQTRIAPGTYPPGHPSPTTLSLASGQGAEPARRRGGLIAGLVIGVALVGGGVVALVAGHGKTSDASAAKTNDTPATGSDLATGSNAVGAAPADAQAVAMPETHVVDAGVPADAPAVVEAPPVDAGVKVVEKHHHTTTATKQTATKQTVTKQGSNAVPTTIDRGD